MTNNYDWQLRGYCRQILLLAEFSDTSSALQECWSILKQKCYRRWWEPIVSLHPGSEAESVNWEYPHCPVKKEFETVQSVRRIMAILSWDVYGVFGLFHTCSTMSVTAYPESIKCLKEAIRLKRLRLLTKGFILLINNLRPHSATTTMDFSNLSSWCIVMNV
jgi:hypothetical protein